MYTVKKLLLSNMISTTIYIFEISNAHILNEIRKVVLCVKHKPLSLDLPKSKSVGCVPIIWHKRVFVFISYFMADSVVAKCLFSFRKKISLLRVLLFMLLNFNLHTSCISYAIISEHICSE